MISSNSGARREFLSKSKPMFSMRISRSKNPPYTPSRSDCHYVQWGPQVDLIMMLWTSLYRAPSLRPAHPKTSNMGLPWTSDPGPPVTFPLPTSDLGFSTLTMTPSAGDIWWSWLETCSNLFI